MIFSSSFGMTLQDTLLITRYGGNHIPNALGRKCVTNHEYWVQHNLLIRIIILNMKSCHELKSFSRMDSLDPTN